MKALVIDHGSYLHIAQKLGQSYDVVFYFCPWVIDGFPRSARREVGKGVLGVERVMAWLPHLNEVDLVICPDVYSWDIVEYCRSLGKPTWGAGRAEVLELERWKTKELMRLLEMPMVPGVLLEGVDALQEHLENPENEDRYIKTSTTRGDFETQHHVNWKTTKPWLDSLRADLGPRQKHIEFIVEEPLSGCECGYDGFTIDGKFPRTASFGYEVKDAGFVGRVVNDSEVPRPLAYCNDALANDLATLGCRGFFSSEVRISEDGTPYLTDPTMRAGSPPSESYMELFDNWDEVIAAGAQGELADLNPVARFAAQIVLKSDWFTARNPGGGPDKNWLEVRYSDSIARWVKLHNFCVVDGQTYVAPQDYPEFGSVVGLGDTFEEAKAAAKACAEQVECLRLRWQSDLFEQAEKCVEEGRRVGVMWDD
jgi:hypothetical protein